MKYNNTLMNNLFASKKNTVNRLLTLLVLTLTIGVGKILADQTALINNVTLPDVPTGTLDMSSQTFKTPDDDGWIVLQPNADIRNANVTWFTAMAWNTSSQTISDVSSYTAPFYTLNSVAVTTVQQTARTKAIRFTEATDISFLVHSGGSRTVYVSLYSYNTLTETQSLVETKSQGNSWGELLFSGLTHTTTYIAYMYESTNSNGYIAEIAIKKYDASSADVDCGAAATLTPNVLGAYNVDQWSAVSPLTFTATAVNGGELSYQWYQWVDGDAEHGTEATKIEAVGTGAKTNSFTPDVTTATIRHYICIVKEAGCTNEARLNVGTYIVNEASLPNGYCYEWGIGTSNTTVPTSGNSVSIMNDFTVSNIGASVYSGTVYSGSGTKSALQADGSGKYITGSLGGKEIASIRVGISTGDASSAAKSNYVVVFSSSTTFSTSNIIQINNVNGYLDACTATSAAAYYKDFVAPTGAKSFAVGRNISGASIDGAGSSDKRYVWYLKACSVAKHSVTYNANGATGGNVPTDANTYAENATFTALGNTGNLVKTGKVFAGWNTQANGLGTPYAVGATVTMGDADMTLYAQWDDPCLAPTINGGIGAYTYDQGATATAITISATANNNGGALNYHWYQYEMGETPAQRVDAVGTGGNTNSFTPSTATVGTRFFICEVTETGCAEVASTISGTFTVNKARATGWVIFDGTFDEDLTMTSVTYSGATVNFTYTSGAIADCSAYTNNADSREYLKSAKISKASDGGNLKFTIPEGYVLTQIDYAVAIAGGNRNIVIAKSFVDASDDPDILFTGLTPGSSKTVKTGSITGQNLEAGDYYMESVGSGGTFEILFLQLVLEADPCNAPTISSEQAAANAGTFAGGMVDYGATKTFTVQATAADANPLKYEWYRNTIGSKVGATKIATTTTNTYSVTNNETTTTTYFFYCVIKSKSCSVETDLGGALTFSGAPACAAPTEVTVNGAYSYLSGQTITLTATPTGGTGTPSYQWQKEISENNWQDIDGATSATYTKESCGYGDSGSYRCVVTTGEGCSTESSLFGVHVFSLDGGYGTEAWSSNDLVFTSGTTGVATVHLEAGKLFKFKVNSHYGFWYGNGGDDPGWDGWYTLGGFTDWGFGTSGGNMRLYTGPEGDYKFTVDVEHAFDNGGQYVLVSVEYPAVTHPDDGYIYYSNPEGWANVAAHWWKDGGYDFISWGDNPWMFTTTICGDTYWYMPKMEGYDRIIFHNPGGDQQTEDLTVAAENADQYYGTDSWNDFTSYTISFDGNGETSGTMSDATVLCGHDITLASNVFERDGATFEGWIADVDVTINNATVTAGDIIADGATLQNVTGNISLTAQWTLPAVPIVSYAISTTTDNNFAPAGSTTDPTNITGIGYSISHTSQASTAKNNMSASLSASTGTDRSKYVEFTFNIATGKQLEPSTVTFEVSNVGSSSSGKMTYHAVLEDECGNSIEQDITPNNNGQLNTLTITNSTSVTFKGAVSLKVYAYNNDNGTSGSAFRMGADVEIYGELATAAVVAVTDFTLSDATIEVEEGSTVTITVSDILPCDATDKSVTWSSDAEGVATVSNGVVTGVTTGTAIITATIGSISHSCTVTVKDPCAKLDILVAQAIAGTNNNIAATGTLGGTAQNYLSTNNKLDDGRYFFVKLANGNLQAGDIIKIDLNTLSNTSGNENVIYLFTGDKDNHSYYATVSTPATGVTAYTLPASFPDGINGIGLYRNSQYNANPHINGITITRPNCDNKTAPVVTISTLDAIANIKEGSSVTFTATLSDATDVVAKKWFKDGVEISGENGMSLTITANDLSATYKFVAYTDLFAAASNEITVTVKTADFCTTFESASGPSYQTDDFTLYVVNSNGVIQSSGSICTNVSVNGVSTMAINSNSSRFAIKLNKPISKIMLYGWNSTTRNINKVSESATGTNGSYTDITSTLTINATKDGSYQNFTITAADHCALPVNKYLWVTFSGSAGIYRICVIYKETEEFIFESNGNWNTATNWNFGVVPSEVDNVTINAAATVNTTGVQCNNLTMGTGSLTIAGSGLLTVNGVLENSEAEKLVVNIPGGIAAADYDNARATVNFHSIAKRNAAGDYQWQYIGWPFTHLADVHWPFSGSWLMRYDAATEDWVNLRNGDGVDPFVGHALTQAAEKDFSWTGTLNAPAATTYDMEYPDGEQNWNLFANSWLAPIAVEQMTTADFLNANAEVYLYNTGSYNEWEASSDFGSSEGQYTTITPGSASTEHLVIPPMQGFFVQTEATGAQLTLDYERLVMGKAANLTQTTALRAPRRSLAGGETEAIDLMPQSYIKICIRGEHYADQMYILISDNYTDGYDNGADGTKIFGSEAAPQLFAPTEYGNMAILATPEIDGTLLGLRAGTADTDYAMTFYGVEGDLYITDLLTNTETLLLDSMTYNFTADNTADIMARFRLNRSTQHGGTTTDIDEGSAGYKVIVREGKVTIWSQLPTAKIQDIRLYDAAGKLLWIESGANKQESGQALEFTLPQQGVYLLRIGSATHKIVY